MTRRRSCILNLAEGRDSGPQDETALEIQCKDKVDSASLEAV